MKRESRFYRNVPPNLLYHLWIPVEGRLELTSGSAAPVAAASGQAFFFNRGTPHGFKNIGTTPAVVLETFVKQATKTADRDPLGDVAVKLAALAALRIGTGTNCEID